MSRKESIHFLTKMITIEMDGGVVKHIEVYCRVCDKNKITQVIALDYICTECGCPCEITKEDAYALGQLQGEIREKNRN